MTEDKPKTPKEALQAWATLNAVTPATMATRTGFTYQHCWNLLCGKTDPTTATLGQIVVSYGLKSVKPIVDAFQYQIEAEAQS